MQPPCQSRVPQWHRFPATKRRNIRSLANSGRSQIEIQLVLSHRFWTPFFRQAFFSNNFFPSLGSQRHVSCSQKWRLQDTQCATRTPHADASTSAAHRCNILRRLEARHGKRVPYLHIFIYLRVAFVDQQYIATRYEDVSVRPVLVFFALDKRELVRRNLPHSPAGGHVPEAHLLDGCAMSSRGGLAGLETWRGDSPERP